MAPEQSSTVVQIQVSYISILIPGAFTSSFFASDSSFHLSEGGKSKLITNVGAAELQEMNEGQLEQSYHKPDFGHAPASKIKCCFWNQLVTAVSY